MKTRWIIVVILLLPLLPMSGFIHLHGAVEDPPRPVFSLQNAASGKLQDAIEKDFGSHFGFYRPLVKLDNTLDLALHETNFNASHCVIIGRENVLIAPDELEFHEREVFDWKKIDAKIEELAAAVKKLKALGVAVKVLLVPSKLDYYPTSIPERWSAHPEQPWASQAARTLLLKRLLDYSIPVLDTKDVLDEVHIQTQALPFPERGRHWTQLASCEILGKMFGFGCGSPILGPASDDEQDLFRCLNAFTPWTPREQLYHAGELGSLPLKAQRVLLVGSSFMRELETEARRLHLFSDLHLFYYNKTDFVGEDGHDIQIDAKWREFIKSRDLIVIDLFAPQIDIIGHGFPAQVLKEL